MAELRTTEKNTPVSLALGFRNRGVRREFVGLVKGGRGGGNVPYPILHSHPPALSAGMDTLLLLLHYE